MSINLANSTATARVAWIGNCREGGRRCRYLLEKNRSLVIDSAASTANAVKILASRHDSTDALCVSIYNVLVTGGDAIRVRAPGNCEEFSAAGTGEVAAADGFIERTTEARVACRIVNPGQIFVEKAGGVWLGDEGFVCVMKPDGSYARRRLLLAFPARRRAGQRGV